MSYNSRLDAILRMLHTRPTASDSQQESSRIYASSAAVLASLTNPLNVTLLTTQILTAPAIWDQQDGLKASLGVYGVFVSATLGKIEGFSDEVITLEEWMEAVVRGANNNGHGGIAVPRWKHILVLGGILSAFRQKGFLPRNTRRSLEDAFCKAANLSLLNENPSELESDVVSLALAQSMPAISNRAKRGIIHDALVDVIVKSMFYSSEGFQSGYFLSKIDNDVMEVDGKLSWPRKSNSFLELQERSARPLFASMNQLSRIAASSIAETTEIETIHQFLDRMLDFSNTLAQQWTGCKLSEVSTLDEKKKLDPETQKYTIPVAWQILKTILFSTVMILNELVSKMLQSEELYSAHNAPVLSLKILTILRRLYFITSRLGDSGFSTYTFVYLSCLDILSQHPAQAEHLISQLAPTNIGTIPPTLMARTLDLYFLNTAEHLPSTLSTNTLEDLLHPAVTPYLSSTITDPNLRPHFEAAHSLMLSIISTPSCSDLSARILPYYIDTLFSTFPHGLMSQHQFRIALSTILRQCSPPTTISELHPDLVDTILELLHARTLTADNVNPVPGENAEGYTEREVMVIAAVEALPGLETEVMERWLWPVAEQVKALCMREPGGPPGQGNMVRERFWDVVSAELDVERAEVAVRWWLGGGREFLYGGEYHRDVLMRSRL